MALINCPECAHEVSTDALACPNCGRPMAAPAPTIQRKVVVADATRDDGFPKWLLVPIVILGAVVVFLLIALMKNEDETADSRNINVNVAQRKAAESRESTSRIETDRNEVTVPPSSTGVSTPATSVPQTVPPAAQTEIATVPADKGLVTIDAKISTKTGAIQSVKNEKFYLLDEDLETILNDAELEPIEGNSLTNSFGLAVLYPDRYSEFKTKALNAINRHIKYNATTDANGKAAIKDVKPDAYYLFGITKTRSGFAVWSSPVSITGGENKLNLSPARLTEMGDSE